MDIQNHENNNHATWSNSLCLFCYYTIIFQTDFWMFPLLLADAISAMLFIFMQEEKMPLSIDPIKILHKFSIAI